MDKKKKHFIKLPAYPGGKEALKSFIAQHLIYPEEADKNSVAGDVLVKYEVNDNGVIVNPLVIKGIGFGCDEEALRLVNMLRYEKVKNRGRRLVATMKINIKFRKPSMPAISYKYQFIEKTQPDKKNKGEIVKSYDYTLNL